MLVTLDVSVEFLEKNAAMIDWSNFCYTNSLSAELLTSPIKQHLDWDIVSSTINLYDTSLVKECVDHLDWSTITFRVVDVNADLLAVGSKFLENFANYLDWLYITRMHRWNSRFLATYSDKIYWSLISYSRFTIAMFKKHSKVINWERLVVYYSLTVKELYELRDYIPWDKVARYQTLSMEGIEKLSTLLDWAEVAEYQPLTLVFIEKYKDSLPVHRLRENKNLLSIMPRVLAICGVLPVQLASATSTEPCPICRVHDSNPFSALVCGHIYHTQCVTEWTEICRTCPMCRVSV
jgi:hypothetical protein